MIAQMSRRERVMVLAGGLVVLLTILYFGIIEPYQNAMDRLGVKVRSRQNQLAEVMKLRSEFLDLQQVQNDLERRIDANPGFSIFSFIESVATQNEVKDNLVSVRPQPPATLDRIKEESVEIRLEKIDLNHLVRFLYSVENAKAVLQIKSLRIKIRFDDKTQLDATMLIAAYGRSQ